jgi:isoquinoline 1-oxidoreductase subunit beta
MIQGFKIPATTSRRRFLQAGSAGIGLMLGFHWPLGGNKFAAAATPSAFAPNAFVRIAKDNSVTVIAKHLEMGQGIYTGLATILAEELDADWAQIRVESAPANAALYNNLNWGPMQGTGGSSGINNSYTQLRQAGATARAMLVMAAAKEWGVPPNEITVNRGRLEHKATARKATFGQLAELAASMSPPAEVTLKQPANFRLIGARLPRVDARAKTNGTARFALDVRPPGALHAVIARPPLFGATVKSFDKAPALAIAGVVDVVQVPAGVAVLARDTWAAMQGREALKVQWDESNAEKRGSAELMAQYRALAEKPGAVARKDGNADGVLAGAGRKLSAGFEFPYLCHAPMEPLNCVVQLSPDACEIWAGDQSQTVDQANAAATAGLKPDQVRIHTMLAGGSFGRRANGASDYVVEGVSIAKAINGRAPVKLVWTREDDVRGGRYRPMYYHDLVAALDERGLPIAWRHRIVGQSILAGTPFEGMVKNGIDGTSVEGAANLPYAIPNFSVELHTTQVGVPVLWWRSVGSTHTAYSTEVFLDELAHTAGQDPVAYRRALLAKHPRHRAVLDLAAAKAGWGRPLTAGKGRGVAVHESFHSFVAQVVEVAVGGDGRVKVERVVCAVDCGVAVNPDVIRAQMEGGIGFALSAALREAVTLNGGRVEQSNFHDYAIMRIADMPKIEVHIVRSSADPTGVGEPGVPPLAPALANAIFAATAKRIRKLPLAGEIKV